MSIKVNKDTCISCGSCVAICPEVFQMDEQDGKAKAVSDDNTGCAKNASDSCPVQAIKFE